MGLDAMGWYRAGRKLQEWGVPLLPKLCRKAIYFLHSSVVPIETKLGEGTFLGYGGIGVVFHKDARVGRHCLISQNVTIGGRSGLEGAPELGDYVRVGAGAKILGNVKVGDFAVIGANAVVVKDVPPGAVVAGVPARVLRTDPQPAKTWTREMGSAPPGLLAQPQEAPGRDVALLH